MKFNERLRDLRLSKNITQKVLATILGMPLSTYSGYEIGKREPDFEILKEIAKYFDVSSDYLLGKSDIVNPYKTEIISDVVKEAESLYRVDPDMLIQMCRATDLPVEERQKIKEYSALLIEKFLRERAEKEKDHDK